MTEDKQEQGEPVALDVTLTEEESEFLRDSIGTDDVSSIRLTVGHGHSGYGLYVSNVDYQDEGASLIANTTPQQRKPLTDEHLQRIIYEHTKLNPNLRDDQELIGYIINAVRAIEAAHGVKE